jgi:hypothetical protein
MFQRQCALHPDFPFGALIEEALVFERDSQLYRTQVVGSLRHMVLRSFVVLGYNRTYQTELSRVAVFDPWSSILVAVYNFESNWMGSLTATQARGQDTSHLSHHSSKTTYIPARPLTRVAPELGTRHHKEFFPVV